MLVAGVTHVPPSLQHSHSSPSSHTHRTSSTPLSYFPSSVTFWCFLSYICLRTGLRTGHRYDVKVKHSLQHCAATAGIGRIGYYQIDRCQLFRAGEEVLGWSPWRRTEATLVVMNSVLSERNSRRLEWTTFTNSISAEGKFPPCTRLPLEADNLQC